MPNLGQFEIKKNEPITGSLKLGDDLTIDISIDVSESANIFNQRYNALVQAERDLERMRLEGAEVPEIMELYERAVGDIMVVVFGEKDTERILDYFQNNKIQLILKVFPYIIKVIAPAIRKEAEALRDEARAGYLSGKRAARK